MSRRPSRLANLLQRVLPAGTAVQAQRLYRLQRALAGLLPPPLGEHCRVAALHDGELVLNADSPAWATRLRYLAPNLREPLAEAGREPIHTVTVSVIPRAIDRPRPPQRAPLSPQSAAHLAEVAETTSDPKLRAALRRLAGRGRRG